MKRDTSHLSQHVSDPLPLASPQERAWLLNHALAFRLVTQSGAPSPQDALPVAQNEEGPSW